MAPKPREFPTQPPGPEEEKITISVKFLKEGLPRQSYTLTRRGMVGSLKNTLTNFLVLGRMEEDQQGMRPNDIVLPNSDKAISRMHACFIYRYGFT